MLRFYRSSNLDGLADSLLDELCEQPLSNPLNPERFIVQNHGMARWISLYIAEKEGIAANLQFNFSAELFWQIIRVMNPDIPENLPSERMPMSWAIFQILKADADPSLSALHDYIRNDDSQKEEMRCWNLACRIGDVFDQYLTYRPKMVLAWERGEFYTNAYSERWEAKLWQKLLHHWHGRDEKNWNHRAKLQEQLITALDKQSIPTRQLPSRISIFGVTEMPPVYLQTFIKLSKLTDVHFYLLGSPDYAHNMLAESMGRTGHEFDVLVKQFLDDDEQITTNITNTPKGGSEKLSGLLGRLKQDLVSENHTHTTISVDETIQVHSCHSARREVEVLYDQLLKMLNENEDLEPSDILVVSPQMGVYASEIDAVFGAVEQQVPKIPFHMAESAAMLHIVYTSFIKLLDLADSRFKLTDVLDFLDCKPVRQAFSFSEDDINTLETWIGDTRIRWGIDATQKETLGLPPSNSYTWKSGLHRMFSGYAMEAEKDALFGEIYPYAEIQQSEDAQLLGRFSTFMHQLFQCQRETKTAKSPKRWSILLNQWLAQFFIKEMPYVRHIQGLQEIIDTFIKQSSQAKFNDSLSFPILCSYLQDQIEQRSTGGGRMGQGVVFSSLIPVRIIPAKVVCMIGMNEGVFPRSKNTVEFDLIAQRPQMGDRVPGRDDRQLFLESIIAAQDCIYFSYTGQSNRKDVQFPPSIVVRELIDYITDHFEIDENKLVQTHRLQEFSHSYFKNNNNLFSYSIISRNVARRLFKPDFGQRSFFEKDLPEPAESYKILSVNDLVSFFQHPAKFLFQERFGIFLREDEILDNDREIFELNGLEKYNIRQELLSRFLDQRAMESYQKVAYAENLLPDGWSGHHAFALQKDKTGEFGQLVKGALASQDKLDPIEINYKWNDFHLAGQLNQVYEEEQLFYRFGRMRAKDLVELWIKHLVLQLAKPGGHPGKSRLIAWNKYKGTEQKSLGGLSNAESVLQELLEMYWAGLQKMTFFFPDSSYAYARAVFEKGNDEEQALKLAQKAWKDPGINFKKEGDDPYNKRMINKFNFLDNNDLKEEFKKISMSFWKPFFEIYHKGQEVE